MMGFDGSSCLDLDECTINPDICGYAAKNDSMTYFLSIMFFYIEMANVKIL